MNLGYSVPRQRCKAEENPLKTLFLTRFRQPTSQKNRDFVTECWYRVAFYMAGLKSLTGNLLTSIDFPRDLTYPSVGSKRNEIELPSSSSLST